MSRLDVLYLSPHLDDVVLSCAGFLLAERERGLRVRVATVMSRGGEDESSRSLYARRRREDLRALAVLGAQGEHLGETDAPWRHAYYCSFETIVLGEHAADRRFGEHLGEVVLALWTAHRPSTIVFPLGVGTHVDHRWVHAAWKRLPASADVAFYEDRPYAFLAEAVGARLRELGAKLTEPRPADLRPRPPALRRRSLLASLRQVGYVRTYLPPGPERLRCARRLARRVVRPAAGGGPTLTPEVIRSVDVDRIEEAVACYGSQIPDLFGDLAGFRREARTYARVLAPDAFHAERRWRLVRP